MVRSWRVGLAALALGLAVGAAGAQAPGGWLPSWLGGGKPAPRPEDKAPSLKDGARKVPDHAAEMETLNNAHGRRLAVCLELYKIADAVGDETLEAEAQRLEALAVQLYKERTGKLLGARSVGLGEGPRVDGGLEETRDLLIRRLEKEKNVQPAAPSGRNLAGGDR